MPRNFEYKDSYGYSAAAGLALLGAFIDVLAVRLALGFAAVTLFAWPSLHRRFGMTPAITLLVVSAIGLVIGAGWVGFDRLSASNQPDASGDPFDNTILVECFWSQLPTMIPSYGFQYWELIGHQADGAYLSTSKQPGTPLGDLGTPNYWVQCRFTNYGNTPVVSVKADFQLVYREAVKNKDGGTTSGNVVESRTVRNPPIRIGTGSDNTVSFFVRNRTPYWADIFLPPKAEIQLVGERAPRIVQLIVNSANPAGSATLLPFFPDATNPPGAAPPVPAPPNTPEKTSPQTSP